MVVEYFQIGKYPNKNFTWHQIKFSNYLYNFFLFSKYLQNLYSVSYFKILQEIFYILKISTSFSFWSDITKKRMIYTSEKLRWSLNN